jgi:hypothetical protein
MEQRAFHKVESITQPGKDTQRTKPPDHFDFPCAQERMSETARVSIPKGYPPQSGDSDKFQTNFSGTIRIAPGMMCSLRKRKEPHVLPYLAESEQHFSGELLLENGMEPDFPS